LIITETLPPDIYARALLQHLQHSLTERPAREREGAGALFRKAAQEEARAKLPFAAARSPSPLHIPIFFVIQNSRTLKGPHHENRSYASTAGHSIEINQAVF
jgi:hypothetical protein